MIDKRDKIILPNMHFVGSHGIYETEKDIPQLFSVALEIMADTRKSAESDDLIDTVDYSAIYEDVESIMLGESCNLLETLAAKIAKKVLEYDLIEAVSVQVEKIAADIGSVKISASVRIYREKRE